MALSTAEEEEDEYIHKINVLSTYILVMIHTHTHCDQIAEAVFVQKNI